MSPLTAILAVAAVFYLAIPGIGAFGVRHRWRRFRRRVIQASLLTPVTYASVRESGSLGLGQTDVRFHGTLESIQGEHTAWVRNRDITIAVDMASSDVYLLAHSEDDRPETPPLRASWSRVGSLPEGMKVLVAGRLDTSGPHATLRSAGGEPVLAVFYDGPESSLVRRCIWSGRQLNEFWNSVTPGALAGGTFALIVLAYFLMRQPMPPVYARFALGLAAVPVLPLLPPGVALFYLYRLSWRRGRTLRAHRDVLMLPLRYLEPGTMRGRLPTGELYVRQDLAPEIVARLDPDRLTTILPPFGALSDRCAVFGRASVAELAPPDDPLCEWIAVRGDPEKASRACRRRARGYEIASAVILGAGLLANFALVMIVIGELL